VLEKVGGVHYQTLLTCENSIIIIQLLVLQKKSSSHGFMG